MKHSTSFLFIHIIAPLQACIPFYPSYILSHYLLILPIILPSLFPPNYFFLLTPFSNSLTQWGTFNFPTAQVPPHWSFCEEVSYLNRYFGNLKSGPHAYIFGDPTVPNRSWHVYSASLTTDMDKSTAVLTLEMCMTGLNKDKAASFYKKDGHWHMKWPTFKN